MKILFIAKYFLPHVGGVEKQVFGLAKKLVSRGHKVTVLTQKYDLNISNREELNGINIARVNFSKTKYLGLIYVWFWFLAHIDFLKKFDVVHFHGNFVWYWPTSFILWKPVYTTFHGWEGVYPIPLKNKLIKQIDAALATKNIAISGYLEKWYGFKADEISWTALDTPKRGYKKDYKKIVYVGRLDEDTGLRRILCALRDLKGYKIDFCGDGSLRKECEKIGKVHGFTDPNKFFKKAFICVSPGITSILEALSYKCLVVTAYDNPLKKDYILTNPYSKWLVVERSPRKMAAQIVKYSKHPRLAKERIEAAYKWVKTQNWDNEVNRYLRLWGKA